MASATANPQILVVATSFLTWLVYKRFEPTTASSTVFLLVVFPGMLATHVAPQFPNMALATLGVYGTFWSLIAAFIVTYRLSPFHPLEKFPGPVLYKITKFALALKYRKGEAREFFIRVHEQYGDVVRIGPNELSFRDGDAVGSILTNKPLPKGPYYDTRVQNNIAQLDGMRNFTEHTKRRKLWNKSVTPTAVKEYGEMLKDVIHELVESLEKRQGVVINFSAWMGYATFDFMGRMAYSRSFGLVRAGKDEKGLVHAVDQGTGDVTSIAHVPWVLTFLNKLPAAGPLKFLQQFTADITKQRITDGSTSKDLYHYLIAEDEPEELRPSKASATADGMLAVIAGSDTAATALSHTIYFLLRNPHCMKRLQVEIDTAFPEVDDTPDYSRQADMPYLNACINESMRLYPPVLSGLQRRVERGTGGRMIGSYFVPEDTQVSAHVPLIQRDPRYFYPLPNDFWPDRFLSQPTYTLPSGETIPQSDLVHARHLFLPFSAGPQNCAGRAIAQQEMRAVVCTILKRFEVGTAEGFDMDSWERNLKDHYVTHRGPLMIKIKGIRP